MPSPTTADSLPSPSSVHDVHAQQNASTVLTTSVPSLSTSAQGEEKKKNFTSALATGLPTLDAALLGGLRRGWITELTGLPNSGKTTLAMAWCRHQLQRDTSCDCVWLQSKPCVDLALLALAELDGKKLADQSRRDVRDAVHVASLPDLDALHALLQTWLSDAASLNSVGLLVIDSITELARNTFSYRAHDTLQRHDALANLMQTLKRLAEEQQVAVLVLTQHHPLQASPFRRDYQSGVPTESEEEDGDLHADSYARSVDASRSGGRPPNAGDQPSDRGLLHSPDVGELGRLFFHNVNVRLRVREAVPTYADAEAAAAAAPIFFDPATMAFTAPPLRPQWQLEVLKCPLCAPLAIGLRLAVVQCGERRSEEAKAEVEEETGVIPFFLSVVEQPERRAMQPASETTGAGGEGLYASIDPWDYTEIPAFLYL